MIPDLQRNFTTPEVPASPPLPPIPPSVPASDWRGWSLLLRLLGVAVAFMGGICLVSIGGIWVLPLWAALFGSIAAVLLRSWWALLMVPVMPIAGYFAAIMLFGGFDLQYWVTHGFQDAYFLVFFPVIPSLLGAAVGTAIGKAIARHRRY
jgi:hypothetical protein